VQQTAANGNCLHSSDDENQEFIIRNSETILIVNEHQQENVEEECSLIVKDHRIDGWQNTFKNEQVIK
jgi:hypothetical protein